MCDQAAAHIRTNVAGASANSEEVHIVHRGVRRVQAIRNRAASGLDGAVEIALVALIGVFIQIGRAFEIEMAELNVTV